MRNGTKFPQDLKLEDTLWSALNDCHVNLPMGGTAEKLGAKFGITREQCDAYALRSQHAWQAANDAGRFQQELVPVEVPSKKAPEVVAVDEFPRGGRATAEALAKLPPVFQKAGLGTAGNINRSQLIY